MALPYIQINDILASHHTYLSDYWHTIRENDNGYTINYKLDNGTHESLTLIIGQQLKIPEALVNEMKAYDIDNGIISG
jgi:hypothetical protein